MQPEEIEVWYQREKERIADEYTAKLKVSGNKDIKRVHDEYDPKFKALIKRYNKLHNDRIDQDELKKHLESKKKELVAFLGKMKKKWTGK